MKKAFRSLLALGVLAPAALVAQQQPVSKDTAATPITPAPIDFSGVVFGNFHYNGGESGNATNSFVLDRSYLTFKMPAGERASIRVTADIYNTSSTSSSSYAFRLKYGYLNYNFFKGSNGFKIDGRVGVIQTPVIDQIENFWPRYIAKTPIEQAGFMQSADVGAASLVSLPSKMGELYLGVLNGAGYQTPSDPDRFKDYTARLTLTPFTGSEGLLKNLTLVGYYYKGTVDGDIAGETQGQKNDRYGAFLGLKDAFYTFGAEWDQANIGSQSGTTAALVEADTAARLWSVFGTIKPFQMMNAESGLPLGIVLRYDYVKPNTDVDPNTRFFVGGLTWDLNKRVQFAVDYQEMVGHDFAAPVASTHTWFAHWVANF